MHWREAQEQFARRAAWEEAGAYVMAAAPSRSSSTFPSRGLRNQPATRWAYEPPSILWTSRYRSPPPLAESFPTPRDVKHNEGCC